MKKTLPLLLILLALFVLTIGSEYVINCMFSELEANLYTTESHLQQEDFTTAYETASACIAYYDTHERFLTLFMPSETLHLFEASIYGMETYITEENRTEALAEAARAHAQLGAIWTIYFRAI